MNSSAAFIHTPIATAMLMVTILLLGLISYELLPVATLPDVDSPTILVTAQLPGADAQTVAGTVTTPLERQFGQIPGLTQMTSSSATEYAEITLQFDRSRTVDSAAQDVQAAINAAAGQLPPTMPNPPIYRKTNPADTPVLVLALTSETLPLTKVSDYANSIVAQKISQMPGVGEVGVGGEQNPAIRVQLCAVPRPGSGANGAGHRHGRQRRARSLGADPVAEASDIAATERRRQRPAEYWACPEGRGQPPARPAAGHQSVGR
jgi:multidrug efflux pump subunit AcrB